MDQMKDFKKRNTCAEAMDDPTLGREELEAVFTDLNRTNTLLHGQAITIRAFKNMLKSHAGRTFHIADMGCGDGDLLRRLARYCRKRKISVSFLGVDKNPTALHIARQRSAAYPEIRYRCSDLTDPGLAGFRCDIVLCTLTLHHFSDSDIPILLNRFCSMAAIGVIINDLERNPLAYYLFQGFSIIFIRTAIARQDGLISIRRGFTKRELLALSTALPGWEHEIRWQWIFRYLWVIQAKSGPSYE